MSDKTSKVYSEVYSFLSIIPEEDRNRIPNKLKEFIKEKRKKEYTPSYTFDTPIEEQKISDESIAMIGLIHLNYLCENKAEKERLKNIFNENEKEYQEKLHKKYNPDDLFKNRGNPEKISNSVAIIEYKKTFFSQLKELLQRLFNKRFNK